MNYKSYIRMGAGAADITPLLHDGAAFRRLVEEITARFADVAVDRVGCVEGRGFLIGSAVAYALGAGLIPFRHEGRLKAARPPLRAAYQDYSRQTKALEIHADAVTPGDRILLIDDWIETGATVRAAIALVERAGGLVVGIGALMDDTTDESRAALAPYGYHYLTRAAPGDPF